MGTAPLSGVHSTICIFIVTALATKKLLKQLLIHTAMSWAELSCQRGVMDISLSDDY